MNNMHFNYKIKQQLNYGLQGLAPDTLSRLDAIKKNALARQKVSARQSMLAGVGSFVQDHFESAQIKQVLLAACVLLGIMSYTYWSADQSIAEIEAIDSALLSDELPIAAFTDKGFNAWLKSSGSQ